MSAGAKDDGMVMRCDPPKRPKWASGGLGSWLLALGSLALPLKLTASLKNNALLERNLFIMEGFQALRPACDRLPYITRPKNNNMTHPIRQSYTP